MVVVEQKGAVTDQRGGRGNSPAGGTSDFCFEIASHFKSVDIIAVIQRFANYDAGIAS